MWELEIPLMKFIGTLASVLTLKSILVVLCSPDWILSKCNSPRFAQSHDKLSTLDLTSECILRWEGGVSKKIFFVPLILINLLTVDHILSQRKPL